MRAATTMWPAISLESFNRLANANEERACHACSADFILPYRVKRGLYRSTLFLCEVPYRSKFLIVQSKNGSTVWKLAAKPDSRYL